VFRPPTILFPRPAISHPRRFPRVPIYRLPPQNLLSPLFVPSLVVPVNWRLNRLPRLRASCLPTTDRGTRHMPSTCAYRLTTQNPIFGPKPDVGASKPSEEPGPDPPIRGLNIRYHGRIRSSLFKPRNLVQDGLPVCTYRPIAGRRTIRLVRSGQRGHFCSRKTPLVLSARPPPARNGLWHLRGHGFSLSFSAGLRLHRTGPRRLPR
jgi:hypothetical protein